MNPSAKRTKNDDWVTRFFRSSDGGRSWTMVNDKGPRGKEMSLVTLRDGAVVVVGSPFLRSEDEGLSWNSYETGIDGLQGTHSLLEEDDGSLSFFAGIRTFGTENERMALANGSVSAKDAPPSQAYLLRSYDGGRTWKERIEVPAWQRPEGFFCEAHVLRRPNGHLLCASRCPGTVPRKDERPPYEPSPPWDETGDHFVMRESLDGGRTWSGHWDVLEYSCVHPHMLNLPDGRILMTYTAYYIPFGIFAVLSDDEGRTFDMEHPIQLAVSRDECGGFARSVLLDDGMIVTVHSLRPYVECEDPKESLWSDLCCDVVRWRLPESAGR